VKVYRVAIICRFCLVEGGHCASKEGFSLGFWCSGKGRRGGLIGQEGFCDGGNSNLPQTRKNQIQAEKVSDKFWHRSEIPGSVSDGRLIGFCRKAKNRCKFRHSSQVAGIARQHSNSLWQTSGTPERVPEEKQITGHFRSIH
jgi:hypothetical protein